LRQEASKTALSGRFTCSRTARQVAANSDEAAADFNFYGVKMNKAKLFGAGFCAFGLVVLSGCAIQEKKEAAAAQAMPVNCTTAPGDLRMLNSEKASTASKIGNGISMVAPIGLVAGLVTRTEKTKYEVTTGEYNKALDTKISEIKAACPGAQAD
jgi:hypothetical protein